MRRSAGLVVGGLAVALVAAGSPPRARAATDVTTFGYDLQRTGLNPQETAIGPGNAGTLALRWSAATGRAALFTQPLVATGVAAEGGGTRDLVYVGARAAASSPATGPPRIAEGARHGPNSTACSAPRRSTGPAHPLRRDLATTFTRWTRPPARSGPAGRSTSRPRA